MNNICCSRKNSTSVKLNDEPPLMNRPELTKGTATPSNTHFLGGDDKLPNSVVFSESVSISFNTLPKERFTEAPILIAPDWDLPFELITSLPKKDAKSRLNRGYIAKNLTLKFETKKELRISPPIICSDLKIHIKTDSEQRKRMKHFPRTSGSIALQDQLSELIIDKTMCIWPIVSFRHSQSDARAPTGDTMEPYTQQEKSSIQDSIGPPYYKGCP
ncbi:hypothetical protein Tco_0392480 [Tanacetum coccineum]